MFSYKIYRRENNQLFLRIINNRKKAELNTGLEISKEDYDKLSEGTPSSRRMKLFKVLEEFKLKINDICIEFFEQGKSDADPKQIRDYIRNRIINAESYNLNAKLSSVTFAQFFEQYLEKITNRGYKVTFDYAKNKIIAFTESNFDITPHYYELSFEDITPKWLDLFNDWMLDNNMSKNSRALIFRNIRTLMNKAIDAELTNNYPFRRFKIKNEATRKRSMSVNDLRKLFDYPCEDYQVFYRDMFKLIFMLCGINTIDLYNLKCLREGIVEYRRAKTKRLYSVKVEPEAMEIINKYKGDKNLLCIADRWKDDREFNRNLNKALKKIGKMTRMPGRGGKKKITPEWPEISTYWARHSWATIAASLDIPKDTIAHALGHGNNTVTDIYIDFDQSKVDDANRKVLDWVLYGRRNGQRRSSTRTEASSEASTSTSAPSYSLMNSFENGAAYTFTLES